MAGSLEVDLAGIFSPPENDFWHGVIQGAHHPSWRHVGRDRHGAQNPQTPAPTMPSSSSCAPNRESLEDRDHQQPLSKETREQKRASGHELI